MPLLERLQVVEPVGRFAHLVAVGLERQPDERPDVGIVVDHQDLAHHRSIGLRSGEI